MLKSKFILILNIIFFLIFHSNLHANSKLKIIENLSNIETLKFNFVQKSFDKKETGVCFLKRPHFLKCLYEDKNQKELIINQRVLIINHKRYNKNNIFAKILRGEIPCKKIYENDFVLSFHDINPQKKIHALVIPKGEYVDLDDFLKNAKEKEITEFFKAISHVAKILKVSNVEGGYRTLSNISTNGGQEVPHLHFHIFGGEKVGKMVL